jgi:hypothetical protein
MALAGVNGMKANLFARRGYDHQRDAMVSLASGLARHGIQANVTATFDDDADFVVTWGDKEKTTKPRLILEAGFINGQSGNYVQDRLRFISTGWNGLHGRADSGRLDCPPERWRSFGIEFEPWNTNGEYVLVCDQHPGDSVAPKDRQWWWRISEAYEEICKVLYRPHPLMADDGMRPLSDALFGARACYTWNSTAAVEAVIRGVPTWSLDEGSMAWPVTSHQVYSPPWLGNRDQWAYNLAYRQWTHDELASGEAWEGLKDGIATDNGA